MITENECVDVSALGKEGMIMRKQKSAAKSALIISSILLCFLLIALLVCYLCTASYYAEHFFPGTVLNGVAVDKMTVEEAEDKVAQEVADYIFSLETRDGDKYQIIGPDIDYTYVPGTEIHDILQQQDEYKWISARKGKKEIDLEVSAAFNANKLDKVVAQLPCFQPEYINKPKDAYLRETDIGYELVPAEDGNQIRLADVQKLAREAVDRGDEKLTLTDEVYEEPKVKSDDKKLKKALKNINSYLHTTIRYDVGEEGEVLDSSRIKEWITIGADYSVTLDESKVTSYVQYLASKYNTYGDVRVFKTSLGDKVKIGGGDYGWVIDKEKEKNQLLSEIKSGKTIEREPVFNQTAEVKSETYDIGNTYVEVDYTNQHMYFYEKGS